MRKKCMKIVAIMLTITLLLTNLSFDVLAQTVPLEQMFVSKEEAIETTTEENDVETTVMGELVDKRESNVKHFRMSDGSITAAVYPNDVHYKDENGELVDIDNSLVEEKDGTDKVLANKKNEFQAKFMKKSNKNKLYTLNKGKEKITVSLDGVSKVRAKVKTETDISEKLDQRFKLEHLGSTVIYKNIYKNVDAEYTVASKEIKENIILKKAVDFDSVTYHYQFNNQFEMVQIDNKTIYIQNKTDGELLTAITAPLMWDAKGQQFDDLTLGIKEAKNGKATVELKWKKKVLEDAEYPVTIDPVMSFSVNKQEIQDTHILAGYPTTNYNATNHVRVRNNGYALLQFPTPSLHCGDKIIHAELMLYPYGNFDNSLSIYTNENSFNPPLFINAHKILRSWDGTTATYQNVNPDNGFYDSTVEAYRIVDGDDGFYTWDITRLANEWTEGYVENYGILLKYDQPPSDGSMFDSFFCSTNGKYISSSAWPQIIYQYINTNGLEDYLSYHSQDLGYAGTGHVNDLTGQLTVVTPLLEISGGVMPISLSLIYNNDSYTVDTYGHFWNLNWFQYIEKIVSNTFAGVKYRDADGTDHYFKYSSENNNYVDEIDSNKVITLITSTQELKMTDSNNTTMYFRKRSNRDLWYLTKLVDAHGNYIVAELDDNYLFRVNKLYSSAGNEVDFEYNQPGFLTKIKYDDGDEEKVITIDYNTYVQAENRSIGKITFPDNTFVQYHYTEGTCDLTKVVDIDGSSYCYEFSSGTPKRIQKVTEYGCDNTMGHQMSMAYEPTATYVTDVTNGRKYLYTFAANGTLKSVVDVTENDGNGYSQYYEYNNGNTTDTKGKDKLTFISKQQKSTVNMLRDHSFENQWNTWPHQAWEKHTGTSSAELSSSLAYLGTKSYQLYRSNDCDASRVLAYDRIDIVLGQQYTFSAYVNTKDITSQGKGASVYVVGEYFEFESEYITETKNEWQRISVTFIAPITGKASVCLSMVGCSGYAYFDCVQVEKGDLSEYNLLENAGYEGPYGTTAEGWGSYGGTGSIVNNEHIAGNYSLKFSGGPNKDNVYQQVIYVTGNAGDTYVASAFAKAKSVGSSGWQFVLMVRFEQWGTVINTVAIPFNSYTTEWQKASGVAKAGGYYTAIVFYFLYCENANNVYFDNTQLIKDTFGSTYTYDEKGNLISTVDLQGKEENTFQYDGNNQLIKETNISGGKIEYTYNSNIKQQLDAVSSGGVKTEYSYDNKGNVTSATTKSSEGDSPPIVSSATYSDNGEYMKTITDSRGNITQYEYNESRGYVDYVTSPDGSITDYTYNDSEMLSNVSVSKDSLTTTATYSYDDSKRLSDIISPSGTTYTFAYDTFSRNNNIKLGNSRNLVNYVYNNKGLLEQLIYGNGITVKHAYDKLNRQTETKINDILRYQYTYDGSSRLLETYDILGNRKIKYDYDILDRFVTERILDAATMTELAKLRIRYDNAKNRVSGYDASIGGTTKSTDYIYGELTKAPDIITGVKQNGTRILSYGYDSLNRLDTRTISTTTPFVTEYGYLSGATTGTTTTLIDSVKNGNDTLTYTYDSIGNITSVSKNGTLIESYTYDYLNQLKTVTRGSDTYEYEYDNGGNILAVKCNGEVIKTYTYGDSEWKDLLTAYNGETITYDAIGNPLTYRGGMNFTWTDGRKLAGITKGTDTISYTYDASGLRNAKTINGTTTEYYWLDGSLQGQKTGNESIFFLYDENGSVYGFTLKNETEESYYYYEFNLQGDIIGIIDNTGNKVVEYTYNERGQLLTTTGTLADTVGQKNLLRYRGYYYDAETGFYYVSSRYYDPEVGRFISADTTDILDVQGDLYDKNLYAYCDNNPLIRIDTDGEYWQVAVEGAGMFAIGSGISFGAISSVVVTSISAITPVGWVVIGTTAVATVVVGISYAKKEKSKQEVDPYAREGQKKQGRETKNKSRRKSGFESRNNKRNGKPAQPKHHTPGREHQKYSQSNKKMELMYKRFG